MAENLGQLYIATRLKEVHDITAGLGQLNCSADLVHLLEALQNNWDPLKVGKSYQL